MSESKPAPIVIEGVIAPHAVGSNDYGQDIEVSDVTLPDPRYKDGYSLIDTLFDIGHGKRVRVTIEVLEDE